MEHGRMMFTEKGAISELQNRYSALGYFLRAMYSLFIPATVFVTIIYLVYMEQWILGRGTRTVET